MEEWTCELTKMMANRTCWKLTHIRFLESTAVSAMLQAKKEYGKRFSNLQSYQHTSKTGLTCKRYQWIPHLSLIKKGQRNRLDGFKKILGTKVHVAVESNGLPVSIVTSPANIHDSTRFIDVMKGISDFLDDESIQQVISVYADKGYDSTSIRNYLKNRNMIACIPFRKNSKSSETIIQKI